MKKQYRLFYRELGIGEVTQENEDFPNLFGTFRPTAGNEQYPAYDKVQWYISYSVAADQLMQEGKEEEWDRFATENEPQFLDLIETDDWHLVDEDGVEPILVPIFCQNSGIVWRWNVHAGARVDRCFHLR